MISGKFSSPQYDIRKKKWKNILIVILLCIFFIKKKKKNNVNTISAPELQTARYN